jgi:hypothetical protein
MDFYRMLLISELEYTSLMACYSACLFLCHLACPEPCHPSCILLCHPACPLPCHPPCLLPCHSACLLPYKPASQPSIPLSYNLPTTAFQYRHANCSLPALKSSNSLLVLRTFSLPACHAPFQSGIHPGLQYHGIFAGNPY